MCRGLVVGRLMVGVGIGISAVVVPTYLAELAPAKLRGRMVELYEVCCILTWRINKALAL